MFTSSRLNEPLVQLRTIAALSNERRVLETGVQDEDWNHWNRRRSPLREVDDGSAFSAGGPQRGFLLVGSGLGRSEGAVSSEGHPDRFLERQLGGEGGWSQKDGEEKRRSSGVSLAGHGGAV